MTGSVSLSNYLAWGLGAWGLFFVAYNYRVIILKKNESLAPLFGGILISLALWAHPIQIPLWVMLLPLVIDPGCIPMILFATIEGIKRTRSTKDASMQKEDE